MKITADYAAAACELNDCIEKSNDDGCWRTILCPGGELTSMMKRVLAAIDGQGSGRTLLGKGGGKVSVISPDDTDALKRKPDMRPQRAGWWQQRSSRAVQKLIEWENG